MSKNSKIASKTHEYHVRCQKQVRSDDCVSNSVQPFLHEGRETRCSHCCTKTESDSNERESAEVRTALHKPTISQKQAVTYMRARLCSYDKASNKPENRMSTQDRGLHNHCYAATTARQRARKSSNINSIMHKTAARSGHDNRCYARQKQHNTTDTKW